MVVLGGDAVSYERGSPLRVTYPVVASPAILADRLVGAATIVVHVAPAKREFFIDKLLARIYFIIQIILVDRSGATRV